MAKKVFIDGKAGTTGLRIYERLESRKDIEIILLSDEQRKDIKAKKLALNSADIAFLCLPDSAAIESVSLIENDNTVVIDTSTAHRTDVNWAYAFPELSEDYENKIKASKRIAVPGCHASGFIALIFPLIEAGILDKSALLSCNSITGYSGGGKAMISEYSENKVYEKYTSPRIYGLSQAHKHLPEMTVITNIDNSPIFCPMVDDFYSGMLVTIPLFKQNLSNNKSVNDIISTYKSKYNNAVVNYVEAIDEGGFIAANKMSGKDGMEISVFGNDEKILLAARYDNLGKGASGAAVEAMNIVLGLDKTTGLSL